MSKLTETAGDAIKRLRLQRGITQRELAEASGLHLKTIQRIERARMSPRLVTLEKIADPLGMTGRGLLAHIAMPERGGFWGEK